MTETDAAARYLRTKNDGGPFSKPVVQLPGNATRGKRPFSSDCDRPEPLVAEQAQLLAAHSGYKCLHLGLVVPCLVVNEATAMVRRG